jgi:hypothetical protein
MSGTTPNAFVSTRDYRDYQGFGTSGADEIQDLQKALSAGNDINNPGSAPGVGFPLRVESLESTLKNVTFEMDEIKLFKTIPKIPATNTVEEFNRLLSYSNAGSEEMDLGWMSEGDLPEEQDSTYERVAMLIKFLGATGRVTHVANTIKAAHGSVIATETMNKTMYLLQQLENSLFFGNSTLVPEQMDGLERLIDDGTNGDNVIDLRGAALTEDNMNDLMLRIRDNYGVGTDAYFNTGPFADFSKAAYERQRFAVAPEPGVLGAKVTQFQSQHGMLNLHDSTFIREGRVAAANGVGVVSKRPVAPTTDTLAAGATAGSEFVVADNGTYSYRVVAGNKYGRSTPVDVGAQAVVAGDGVTFNINDGGNGTTYYEIYRTVAGAAIATATSVIKVARTAATQVFTDLNADLPGTSKGFVLMQNQRSLAWAQLLPMTRIPLAAIDTSIRWAQVIYGAIKLYAPRKNLVVKNIGRAAGSLP